MFGWFKSKDLSSYLKETRKIKIKGVIFHIRKINPLDHVDGSKVLLQIFDTYRAGKAGQMDEVSFKKVKAHYADVFMSSVVKPTLSRKEEGDGVFVEEIFRDWEMAEELYQAVLEHSYGKKNLKRSLSRANA